MSKQRTRTNVGSRRPRDLATRHTQAIPSRRSAAESRSALLVDIGNTRVKWATLRNGRLGALRAASHRGWAAHDFTRHVLSAAGDVGRVVVVSVAGERIDRMFASAVRRVLGIEPEFFESRRHAAGVTTLYAEPWRLGADRLAAAIGGYHLSRGGAACVIGVGTALTVDLVDARGRHRGGIIVPAPALMKESLLANTSGIRRRASGGSLGADFFARSTRAAIEQGSLHAAAAIIDRAIQEARHLLRRTPRVLVTGGAAEAVLPFLRSRYELVPDLVLRGLAAVATERDVRA